MVLNGGCLCVDFFPSSFFLMPVFTTFLVAVRCLFNFFIVTVWYFFCLCVEFFPSSFFLMAIFYHILNRCAVLFIYLHSDCLLVFLTFLGHKKEIETAAAVFSNFFLREVLRKEEMKVRRTHSLCVPGCLVNVFLSFYGCVLVLPHS